MATRISVLLLLSLGSCTAFFITSYPSGVQCRLHASPLQREGEVSPFSIVSSVEEASKILQEWDTHFKPEQAAGGGLVVETRRLLPDAVKVLNAVATQERNRDPTKGRCMLGICASSVQEGVSTLKAWVTALQLPRGLLHGMDKDGVPLDIDGGVYIKYNSGGVYTFAEIRKAGLGFESLWKPGDAMLERYDGIYRGVYFQVELLDGEFRQYLVPLDTFSG